MPDKLQTRIKNDVGEFLVEQIISSAAQSKSPVAGGEWQKALSPAYKKKKKSEGLPPVANLEEEGDLLDALTSKSTDSGLELGWFGAQAGKADGHNNFSGRSNLPRRQALPDVGQDFKAEISKGVEAIISENLSSQLRISEDRFDNVATRAELYEVLSVYFPDSSRGDIRRAVTQNAKLAGVLGDLGLLKLL